MDVERRSLRMMCVNVFSSYGLIWIWVVSIGALLNVLFDGIFSIRTQLPSISITVSLLGRLPRISDIVFAGTGVKLFILLFFAPVVEEAVFRMLPLTYVAGRHPNVVRATIVVVCGILFGLFHGHPFNVFIQGFVGVALGRLYLANANSQFASYLSCAVVHAMYNFTVLLVGGV